MERQALDRLREQGVGDTAGFDSPRIVDHARVVFLRRNLACWITTTVSGGDGSGLLSGSFCGISNRSLAGGGVLACGDPQT